jgi:beta-lactamase regulating signal transducer with metallopeptidase domain
MIDVFLTVLNMSLTAAFVIAALCLARLVLQKMHAPTWVSYALWAVAGLNLLCPFKLESVFSLIPFNTTPIPRDIAMQAIPRIDSGIRVIDNAVSGSLPAATPSASINPLQVWTAIGTDVWLFGVAVMLLYAIISYVWLLRRKERVTTPFVYGFIRPKMHIPRGLEGEELRYVTLHEQTHIKRGDHLVKLFAFALLCVHWFNPFAWVAFMLLCADMEMSCDERVLRELGMGAKADYSQALLSLSMNRRIFSASPLAFGEGGVKARVKNVLSFKRRSRVIIVVAVALVVVLTVGFALSRTQPEADTTALVISEATVSFEGETSPLALNDRGHIPFVELGSTISLTFEGKPPVAVAVIEIIANADGSRKYAEEIDKSLNVDYSGLSRATFRIEENLGVALSSDSDNYRPGNAYRWYRIILNDSGRGTTEYGLWLRTDPTIMAENSSMILEQDPAGQQPQQSSRTALENLPADYGTYDNREQAIADNVYINVHDAEIYNQGVVDSFYEQVSAGNAAFMRAIRYTTEGDPMIFDYQYNGEMFTVRIDSSRDTFGGYGIDIRTYRFLVNRGDAWVLSQIETDREVPGSETYWIPTPSAG